MNETSCGYNTLVDNLLWPLYSQNSKFKKLVFKNVFTLQVMKLAFLNLIVLYSTFLQQLMLTVPL